MNILVSACLLGIACKYSGGDNACPALLQALRQSGHTLIPVCPEVYGGLPTPRPGAEAALQLARLYNCRAAILKANSPSCGSGTIYDGTFCHRRISGDGLTAALLKANGVQVYNEDTFAALL